LACHALAVLGRQPLTITAPSHEAALALAERLSFTDAALEDGEVQGCRVVVSDPSADVFNRTLSAVSGWLEDSGLASVEVEFDGAHYVVDANTTERLGLA
jgi:hypothetical protein